MGLFDGKPMGDEQESPSQVVENDHVIYADNVAKQFGLTKALNDLSLQVPRGSVYALLGPNGAGKTTFVKCLLGLVHRDGGELRLQGCEAKEPSARQGTAYLPEKFSFYPYYTVKGVLRLFGHLHGQRGEGLENLIDQAIKRLDIEEIKNRKLKTLSKGQLQRTGVATLLVSQSEIFILDEPFSGLDPIGVKEMKDLFLELKKEGKTLFINSHILSEMEQLCDQVAILHQGHCLTQGPLRELLGQKSLEDYFYEHIQKAKKGQS